MIYALIAPLIYLLIQILKATPTIEIVPKVVELLHGLLRRVHRAQLRYGLLLAKSCLTDEDGREQGEEFVWLFVDGLFGRRLRGHVGGFEVDEMLVDGVVLPPALRVGEDLEGFLDAFEEGVVVRRAS
jgi:hypothetical protein